MMKKGILVVLLICIFSIPVSIKADTNSLISSASVTPSPGFELLIRDASDDLGEDRNECTHLNDSPDIWVRRSQDGLEGHQNPVFTTAGQVENYIYVRITNIGEEYYDPKVNPRYLHLNWAKGSPIHSYRAYSGIFKDSTNNIVGSSIKSILLSERIPALTEDDDDEDEEKNVYIACIPFKTHGYPAELEGGPFSIIATISDQPYGLLNDATRGYYPDISTVHQGLPIREKKTIAVKSSYIPEEISDDRTSWSTPIYIQSPDLENMYYSIRIESGNSLDIFKYLYFTLEYPSDMLPIYPNKPNGQAVSDRGPSRIVITGENPYTFIDGIVSMEYIPIKNDAFRKMKLTCHILPDVSTVISPLFKIVMTVKKYTFDEIDDYAKETCGSYTFTCALSKGKFRKNTSTIVANIVDDTSYELSYTLPDGAKGIEWLDEDNRVISKDESVVVNGEYDRSIKCRLLSDASDETECIELNALQRIKSIRKLPTGYEVQLNTLPTAGTSLRITPVQHPERGRTICLGGENSLIYVDGIDNERDFLLFDLIENDSIISSMTVK